MYLYVYAYMFVCMQVYVWKYVYMLICVCTCVYLSVQYVYISMCVCACISVCNHTCVCVLELESYSFDVPSKFICFFSRIMFPLLLHCNLTITLLLKCQIIPTFPDFRWWCCLILVITLSILRLLIHRFWILVKHTEAYLLKSQWSIFCPNNDI